MRVVFSNREFQKLFFSNLFSSFGQGMTMIGISWYLVETTGQAKLLGSTMLISAVLMFFIGPYIGTLIDRFSRKKILLFESALGFVILAILALWGFFGPYAEWMLISIFLVTTFMFQIHYPAQSALVQEGFEPKDYNDINSLLEIENQTAAVLSGAAAGIMLQQFGLHIVLLINALTYLVSFLLLGTMQYTFTLEKHAKENEGTSWLEQLWQSWEYMKRKRGFIVFGISALMPFIAVMASNLLAPVFVDQTLKAGVTIYSLGEVTYSIGAVAAGICIAAVTRKLGDFQAMVAGTLLFAFACILTVAFPKGWVFVLLFAFVGWCNASTRLIRLSLYMKIVPKHMMGRVGSFLNSVGMLMRLILIGLFTFMIDVTGAGFGYLVLAGLLLLAAVGIIFSMCFLLAEAPASSSVAMEEN